MVVQACLKQTGNVGQITGVALQQVDHGGVGKGKQLNQYAACSLAAAVGIHQNAKGAHGGDLLALGVICGNVLGDLAAHQLNGAVVGLVGSHVTNDVQKTLTHCAANVQFAVLLQGQIHLRILNISSHVANVVRNGQHSACRAIAVEGKGDGVVLFTQHAAHERGDCEESAKGGGGGGSGVMIADGSVYDIGGADHMDPSAAVGSHCA